MMYIMMPNFSEMACLYGTKPHFSVFVFGQPSSTTQQTTTITETAAFTLEQCTYRSPFYVCSQATDNAGVLKNHIEYVIRIGYSCNYIS